MSFSLWAGRLKHRDSGRTSRQQSDECSSRFAFASWFLLSRQRYPLVLYGISVSLRVFCILSFVPQHCHLPFPGANLHLYLRVPDALAAGKVLWRSSNCASVTLIALRLRSAELQQLNQHLLTLIFLSCADPEPWHVSHISLSFRRGVTGFILPLTLPCGMRINVLDGTADGVQCMYSYWCLYCLLSALFPLLSLSLQRLLWRRTWGNRRGGTVFVWAWILCGYSMSIEHIYIRCQGSRKI